jgi:hypothetical protein
VLIESEDEESKEFNISERSFDPEFDESFTMH